VPPDRAALLRVKLAALVRDHWGEADRRPSPFPGGSALAAGGQGWVLVDVDPERALGGALAWGWRQKVEELHVLVDAAGGGLARRAGFFRPAPSIWAVEGRDLTPAEPIPLPDEPELPLETEVFADLIRSAGAEPVVEHGVLRGEVLGLEVARVEDGRLLVGVGKHDREAHLLAHPDRTAAEGLTATVDVVAHYRRTGVGAHPANQLSVERWLRSVVIADPALAGLPPTTQLRPVPSPVARADLRQPAPAPALGDDLLVVCSVGVDTDFVPAAADAWAANGRPSRLVLCVPEGDDHPVTRAVAGLLEHPAEVVTVPSGWRDSGR
jgi:hypothetical protein